MALGFPPPPPPPPPGKVSPLQVLKKYSTAHGMQVADFMWMKLLSIECMIQLRFAILEKNLSLPDNETRRENSLVIFQHFT